MLRSCFRDNFKWVRAQSALMALLYVFLCTFGTLTHTHVGHNHASGDTPSQVGASAHKSSKTARVRQSRPTVSAVASCAFCDWQANSHARTVTPFALYASLTFACAHVPFFTALTTAAVARASSRAPPALS